MKKQLVQWNLDVTVMKAKTKGDAHRVAIHLLNPTQREFDDAQERAERDMFGTIVLHTKKTWPLSVAKLAG